MLVSYGVKALFTSWSVDSAISILGNKLQSDPQLHNRTSLSPQHIITLLELCLTITFFLFQGNYFEQVHGSAMGCPMSPLIANLFMEEFGSKAISTTPIDLGFDSHM